MCNLYSITTNQAAIIALFRVVNRYVGNLAPMPGVFRDYNAPIVRNGAEGRELATARWGMPSSSRALMDATKKRAEKLQAKGKSLLTNDTTSIPGMTSKIDLNALESSVVPSRPASSKVRTWSRNQANV